VNQELKSLLEEKLGPVQEFKPVAGGDISKAYHLSTSFGRYFVKILEASEAFDIFLLEKLSLEMIADTGTIKTPEIHFVDRLRNLSFLVMDFIESKTPNQKDYQQLGAQLAQMHQVRQTSYGWEQDNFIGTLQQSNKLHDEWPGFYVQERLQPQIQLAHSKRLLSSSDVPIIEQLHQTCKTHLQPAYPSLIHGDLWGGNFLIDTDSTPYLIDPATYFGHHYVDIAMSQLFGGFDVSFYAAYYEESIYPPISQEQKDLYQLYYLLVHLNLFGTSYHASVQRIIQKYFLH
jgi:fructosamine-3-kinase